MGIFKMTESNVSVACICGKDVDYDFSELMLMRQQIICPPCPSCKFRFSLIMRGKTEKNGEIQKVIQTLGSRLNGTEQQNNDVGKTKPEWYAMAEEWKKGSTMECPIHPTLARERKKKGK